MATSVSERRIKVMRDNDPVFARVILTSYWEGKLRESRGVLLDVLDRWSEHNHVKYTLTCGGFLLFDWPEEVDDVEDSIEPDSDSVKRLFAGAQHTHQQFLSEDLKRKLATRTRYFSCGVDSYDEETQWHVELVAFTDLEQDRTWWTGKSYPVPYQEGGLVRITDFSTHFVNLPDEMVMVLGCHDLNIFSRRTQANAKYWRRETIRKFLKLTHAKHPTTVLQHPHTADTYRTWITAWSGLTDELPFVKRFAGGGRYFYDEEEECRAGLEETLEKTKLGNSIDFVVYA